MRPVRTPGEFCLFFFWSSLHEVSNTFDSKKFQNKFLLIGWTKFLSQFLFIGWRKFLNIKLEVQFVHSHWLEQSLIWLLLAPHLKGLWFSNLTSNSADCNAEFLRCLFQVINGKFYPHLVRQAQAAINSTSTTCCCSSKISLRSG